MGISGEKNEISLEKTLSYIYNCDFLKDSVNTGIQPKVSHIEQSSQIKGGSFCYYNFDVLLRFQYDPLNYDIYILKSNLSVHPENITVTTYYKFFSIRNDELKERRKIDFSSSEPVIDVFTLHRYQRNSYLIHSAKNNGSCDMRIMEMDRRYSLFDGIPKESEQSEWYKLGHDCNIQDFNVSKEYKKIKRNLRKKKD